MFTGEGSAACEWCVVPMCIPNLGTQSPLTEVFDRMKAGGHSRKEMKTFAVSY